MQWIKSLNADSGSDWDNLSGYLNQAFPTFLISRPTYFYVWWTVAHLMSFPLFNVHNIIPTQNKDDKNKRCTFKLPSIWHHSSSQTSINFWSSGDHQESARGPKPMVEKGWPKQPECLSHDLESNLVIGPFMVSYLANASGNEYLKGQLCFQPGQYFLYSAFSPGGLEKLYLTHHSCFSR